MKREETMEACLGALQNLQSEIPNDKSRQRDTLQTLFKIITNLISKPLDPQVRRFNKSNKSIQEKILNYKSAINFLHIVISQYNSVGGF